LGGGAEEEGIGALTGVSSINEPIISSSPCDASFWNFNKFGPKQVAKFIRPILFSSLCFSTLGEQSSVTSKNAEVKIGDLTSPRT